MPPPNASAAFASVTALRMAAVKHGGGETKTK
jgi:hypothetical protein